MNNVKSGSDCKTLKGFTLIEMIVVMAIIAVLAGIVTNSIQGFQRDARMEADNNRAQMAYMGFQNMLTRCEVMQNRTVFDADALRALDSGSPSHTNDGIKYSVVNFTVSGGDISGAIDVKTTYTSGSMNSSFNAGSKAYKKLRDTIMGNLTLDYDGTIYVYVNYEDYTVDAACYFEDTDGTKVSDGLNRLTQCNSASSGSTYKTLEDGAQQKSLIKLNGLYIGAYPKKNEVA